MNIYDENFKSLRQEEIFIQLPVILQDIILILDFDIELQMNGIIGFLENSTGNYIEETILSLDRINATKDFKIMNDIKVLLSLNGISTKKLREDVNNLSLYQVTNSSEIHDNQNVELLNKIATQADQLYLYRDNDSIFDNLFKYVEEKKMNLMKYLQ
ncbi:DMP19 family protein [Paenibacillus sedimenti]|uniref:DUF4375 domain-containing protein n=1 Tax=Paenibacillus sedimenti TaxID=2770274 RepID=A0A926KTG2_9BACL|nr:DUF4375 domain-containing protein [Paenibacillus sedimenti]MBD0381923.1 DUF4375 domain-containing protein [Paenibacillus sedimenti]